MDSTTYAKIFPREYFNKFLEKDCRPDGRDFTEFRNTVISVGAISSSDGSSMVKLGETVVMCGVKLEVGIPTLEKPKEGAVTVKLTFPTTAGVHISDFSNRQRLDLETASLSELLQSSVSSNNLIALEQLCIIDGKAVWRVYVDVVVVSDAGNVFDAATLAIVSALGNTLLPHTHSPDELTVYTTDGEPTPLVLSGILIPATVALVGEKVLVDPSLEESKFASSYIHTIFDQQGNIVGFHKPGGEAINDELLQKVLQLGAKRAGLLSKKLKTDNVDYPVIISSMKL